MSRPQQKYFPLAGGLDLVTSPLKLDPGRVIASSNYECGLLGGYTRIEGYERYDGKFLPSGASYWILNFTSGNVAIVADQLATGRTSGATGIVLDVVLTSGAWADGNAAGYAVIINLVGVFVAAETVALTGANPGFNVGFSGGFS